ncbi:hypothetical protein BDN72DRAFT_777568, partial [Pluteus cervinus]
PSSWRLVNRTQKDGDEVMFTVQGVIEAKDLPPIFKSSKPKEKPYLLNQNITLTGLGTATFEQSLSALREMHPVISRQFPEGRVTCSFLSGTSLTFSNRFFTKRSEGGQMISIPFSPNVDPKNVLTHMLNPLMIHTEENEVKYFVRQSDLGRNFKYFPTDPQTFRVGDIVEIQCTLVVYKMREENYICKLILYSVALLDSKYGNVSYLCLL